MSERQRILTELARLIDPERPEHNTVWLLDRIEELASKDDSLASRLAMAWGRYAELFGEPPHGTEKQMAALLELLPAVKP